MIVSQTLRFRGPLVVTIWEYNNSVVKTCSPGIQRSIPSIAWKIILFQLNLDKPKTITKWVGKAVKHLLQY